MPGSILFSDLNGYINNSTAKFPDLAKNIASCEGGGVFSLGKRPAERAIKIEMRQAAQ